MNVARILMSLLPVICLALGLAALHFLVPRKAKRKRLDLNGYLVTALAVFALKDMLLPHSPKPSVPITVVEWILNGAEIAACSLWLVVVLRDIQRLRREGKQFALRDNQ